MERKTNILLMSRKANEAITLVEVLTRISQTLLPRETLLISVMKRFDRFTTNLRNITSQIQQIQKRLRIKTSKVLKMMASILDNGPRVKICDMVKELRYGMMVLSMRVNGEMTKLMALDDLSTPMGMFMKVNGLRIRLMVKVYTRTPMVHSIQVTGKMINRMDKELKLGQMVRNILDNMLRARSTERESSHGATAHVTKANSGTTTFMAEVFISGPMVDDMRETGETTKWMVVECSHGKTDVVMMVNTSKIRKKVVECLHGLMDANTRVSGLKVNSMVKVCTPLTKVSRREVNGKKAKDYAGSLMNNFN